MGTPRRSLNDRILWLQVLDALSLPTPAQALPAVTNCPLCNSGRLLILQDHLAGGQWHWCGNCHTSGDMIELAAEVWKLNIPATVAKLAGKGLSIYADRENVRLYVEQHVDRREQLWQMWLKARNQFVNGSTSIQRLVHTLRIGCDVPYERLEKGMGQLIGGIHHEEAQAVLRPGAKETLFKSSKTSRWGDVITVPFYDVPGRVCAFLFIGRKGRPDKDFVFKRTNIATRIGLKKGSEHTREAGLCMHPNLLNASTEWGGIVVAVDNPLLALQLHARHLSVSMRPLPIVGWYASDAHNVRKSWQIITGKKLVIWAPFINKHVIQQAVYTNARISTIGPRADLEEDLNQYIWRQTTEDLVKDIRDSAQPWPQVIANHFESLADTDLESLLLELKLNGLDLNKLLKRCPSKLVDRLTGIINQQPVGRTIGMDSKVVVERGGGWYTEGQRADQWELIMDAQLRIDALIWQKRSGRQMYQGRLIHQGKEYPFCTDKATLDKQPFDYLQGLLLEHGKFLTFAPKWATKIAAVAVQFHQPKIVRGAEVVGWDIERLAFVLPRYRIEIGGDIKSNKGVFPPGSPAENLPEPEPLSGAELHELLDDTPVSGMMWAAATSILANVLAPAFNQKPSGIATIGSAMSDIGWAVAEELGCDIVKITSGRNAPEEVRNKMLAHRWPVRIQAAKSSKALVHFVDETRAKNPYHNCITPLNWYVATVLRLQGGWHVLESADVGGLRAESRAMLRRLIPAYLLDLAERRYQMDSISGNGNWWDNVLTDVEEWMKKFGVDSSIAGRARDYYAGMSDGDEGNAEALADLTSQLTKESKFAICPDGFQDSKLPTLLKLSGVFEEDAIAIPKAGLVDWAAKQNMLLDCSRVTAVLIKASVLLEDRDDYWIVPESWWMSRLQLTQNAQTGLLRLRA